MINLFCVAKLLKILSLFFVFTDSSQPSCGYAAPAPV